MDRLAPNTAALDTPSVAGEAMGLPSTVCMTSPAADSPAPAMTAASRRGRRMYRIMRTAAVSPCPSSASTHERTDMPDEPTSSSVSASSTTAAASTVTTSIFFFCEPCLSMRRLPGVFAIYFTPCAAAPQPYRGVADMRKMQISLTIRVGKFPIPALTNGAPCAII